jgi:hypothetical protein
MNMKRPRIHVNLGELDQLLDQAREVPLSEPDCNKLKTTLHALAELLAAKRSTEKTNAVVPPEQPRETPAEDSGEGQTKKPNGHGRTPASA